MGMVLERYLIYCNIHPGWICSLFFLEYFGGKQTPHGNPQAFIRRGCCGPGHRPTPANGRRTRMAPRLPIRARWFHDASSFTAASWATVPRFLATGTNPCNKLGDRITDIDIYRYMYTWLYMNISNVSVSVNRIERCPVAVGMCRISFAPHPASCGPGHQQVFGFHVTVKDLSFLEKKAASSGAAACVDPVIFKLGSLDHPFWRGSTKLQAYRNVEKVTKKIMATQWIFMEPRLAKKTNPTFNLFIFGLVLEQQRAGHGSPRRVGWIQRGNSKVGENLTPHMYIYI